MPAAWTTVLALSCAAALAASSLERRRRRHDAGRRHRVAIERHREQRNAGVGLRGEPQQHQREADVTQMTRQEQACARTVEQVARRFAARKRGRDASAEHRADRVRGEVQRARDARRNVHLERFHRERHRGADRDAVADTLRRRSAAAQQRDEKAERRVRERVQQRVVANPACRRAEQEERRSRGRWRAMDGTARAIRRRSRGRTASRARAASACAGATTRTPSPWRDHRTAWRDPASASAGARPFATSPIGP